MPQPIIAAVADSQLLLASFIADSLQSDQCNVSVVATHGKELIDKLEQVPCSPNILIMDSLLCYDDTDVHAALNRRWPAMKKLIISPGKLDDLIFKLMDEGANGFITKNTEPEMLAKALAEVIENGYYSSPEFPEFLTFRNKHLAIRHRRLNDEDISAIRLLCNGDKLTAAASNGGISKRKLEKLRERVSFRTSSHGRISLLRNALRLGIIRLDSLFSE